MIDQLYAHEANRPAFSAVLFEGDMRMINSVARFLAFCTVGVLGFGQRLEIRETVEGAKTIAGYRLSQDARTIAGDGSGQILIRLPFVERNVGPELLGMLRNGDDIEVFLGWQGAKDRDRHFEAFRGKRGGEAALVHDFRLASGGFTKVSFFQPPDGRDTAKVLIDVLTAGWAYTTYLLAPDRQSVVELFEAMGYVFLDLDRDGVYELVKWERWGFDVRCNFNFDHRESDEIYVRAGAGYRKVWPPADWVADNTGPRGASVLIETALADLDGDGGAELIVLKYQLGDERSQALAVYELDHQVFRLLTRTSLPPEKIAYGLKGLIVDSSGGKLIIVRTATPAACAAGGPDSSGEDTPYVWHGHKLEPTQ